MMKPDWPRCRYHCSSSLLNSINLTCELGVTIAKSMALSVMIQSKRCHFPRLPSTNSSWVRNTCVSKQTNKLDYGSPRCASHEQQNRCGKSPTPKQPNEETGGDGYQKHRRTATIHLHGAESVSPNSGKRASCPRVTQPWQRNRPRLLESNLIRFQASDHCVNEDNKSSQTLKKGGTRPSTL